MPEFSFTPQLGVIVGGLIGLIIGWVIGFFDSNSRTAKKIQEAEAKAESAKKEAERRVMQAEQQAALASQTVQTVQTVADDPGLLRLKNENGRYALEIDGAPVISALPPEGRKRLIDLLTVIRPYLEGGLPPQAAPQPKPAAPVMGTPPQPSPQPAPVQPSYARPVQPPPPVQPVPATLGGAIGTVIGLGKKPAEDEKKPFASLSMVGQIDSILQERIARTPMATMGIRLMDSITGGVEVQVGINKYEAVDDVPDPEVKAAIRSAIAEWEKKYTPGL